MRFTIGKGGSVAERREATQQGKVLAREAN